MFRSRSRPPDGWNGHPEAAREQLADQRLGFDEAELTGWLVNAGFSEVAIERIVATTGQESILLVHGHANSLNKP